MANTRYASLERNDEIISGGNVYLIKTANVCVLALQNVTVIGRMAGVAVSNLPTAASGAWGELFINESTVSFGNYWIDPDSNMLVLNNLTDSNHPLYITITYICV